MLLPSFDTDNRSIPILVRKPVVSERLRCNTDYCLVGISFLNGFMGSLRINLAFKVGQLKLLVREVQIEVVLGCVTRDTASVIRRTWLSVVSITTRISFILISPE